MRAGGWQEVRAVASDESQAKVYSSPDKSPKDTQKEVHTKLLFKEIAESLPQQQFGFNRRDGVVFSGSRAIAKVAVDAPGVSNVRWAAGRAEELGSSKVGVADAFETRISRRADAPRRCS